jgi:hypothetical protein
MQGDFTKLFLFVALSALVIVLVTNGNKGTPLASAPLDPDQDISTSNDPDDAGLVTAAKFANVPSNGMPLPLMLMMPKQGVQPLFSEGDDAL